MIVKIVIFAKNVGIVIIVVYATTAVRVVIVKNVVAVYNENEVFTGATMNSVFGSVNLDLRSCIINDDVVIECTAVFGGSDIFVPNDVNIKVTSTPIFGGVSNKARGAKFIPGVPTVYINAVCMFGGVDIK